ncbi:MAG: DUF5011 domain-containing protein [Patescibacteria group bacterium]|nr:DUF5011 domain-containing protein [Patescibacteria group bacterium]MDD4304753.1 DUF5011 domain-containing protein [Patescibacteria group bacterium]MDD4695764.1 DUF5011 domain-containing protein [Patescibacteria group bacterium]
MKYLFRKRNLIILIVSIFFVNIFFITNKIFADETITITKDARTYVNSVNFDEDDNDGPFWSNQEGQIIYSPYNDATSNLEYAMVTLNPGERSKYIRGINYGFEVPMGSTINNIQATIRCMAIDSSIREDVITLVDQDGQPVGDDDKEGVGNWPIGQYEDIESQYIGYENLVYGDQNDTWGITDWTAEEINNNNFGVMLSVKNFGQYVGTAMIDNIQTAITYTTDTTPPEISEITPVINPTNKNNPSYTFFSSEKGLIEYFGNCKARRRGVLPGENIIELQALNSTVFNSLPLQDGEYNDCRIIVTDAAGNESNELIISSFLIDTIKPVFEIVNDLTTEATNALGANMNYSPIATDTVDIDVQVACTPNSSSIFALGDTMVNCIATDDAGNQATTSFKVSILDTTSPTIELIGSNSIQVYKGDSYYDAGAMATDLVDGDLTENMELTNTVDINTVGTYSVIYVVSDTKGNTSTSTRTVNVVNRPSSGGSGSSSSGGTVSGQVLGEKIEDIEEEIVPIQEVEEVEEIVPIKEVLGEKIVNIDMDLSKRLSGRLLLQVEDGGRIWYVSPTDYKRHEIKFANALLVFQKLSLGITNKDLENIPLPDTKVKISEIAKRLSGRLLLQVEDGGRIWYVSPTDYKRYEATWSNLMSLFQKLSLGINNENLEKIEIGNLE